MLHVPCRSDLVVHLILKTTLLGLMLLFYDNFTVANRRHNGNGF